MDFARELWAEIRAAYGTRWTVLSVLVSAAVARIDKIAGWLAGRGIIQSTLGFPDWVLGLVVFFGWTAFTALSHAVKLRRRVTPRFSMLFDPSANRIEPTPLTNPAGIVVGHCNFLRVLLKAETDVPISECRLWITGIKEIVPGGQAPIHIPHNIWVRSKAPFKIYPGVTETADFLKCDDGGSPVLAGLLPNVLRNAFVKHGTYRFTLTAWGDGASKTIDVDVSWFGKWDGIVANQVK